MSPRREPMAVPEFFSGKILYPAIVVLLGLSTLFGAAILPRLLRAESDLVGSPAPDFTVEIVAGGEPGSRLRLSDLRGRPVVLDFWASWCGPCLVQAPILDRVARRHADQDLLILGVNKGERAVVAREFARKKGLSYPIALDEDEEISSRYRVSRLPSLVVIGRDGKVRSYQSGLVDEALLKELIAGAL